MKKENVRKTIWIFLFLTGFCPSVFPQSTDLSDYNLGFEKVSNLQQLPDGWLKWGSTSFNIKLDSIEKRSGKYALLIEPENDAKENEFGSPGRVIPAIYEGKEITVKAFMKAEKLEKPIGLLLSINGQGNHTLEFDNMQQKGILGSEQWTEYSVTLPLPEKAENIYIGAILSGKGKLWVDDFQVLIDDRDLSLAPLKTEKKYPSGKDIEFDESSKIQIQTYTSRNVVDLEILCRTWGFLKYYHPAIAAGNYDWDAELFRIMPLILKVQSPEERNKILIQWIKSLGEITDYVNYEKEEDGDVKMFPDLKWIENTGQLGKELSDLLNQIKNARREHTHYYVSFPGSNPSFTNEKKYYDFRFNDDGFRLLALFRYWNIIQYYFPYRHLTNKDWNSVLGEYIPMFIEARSELDYKLAVLRLIVEVCDTHASLYDRMIDDSRGIYTAPYLVTFIEGKPVITHDILSNPDGLKKGDVITGINGQAIEKMIERELPYTAASNYPTQLRNLSLRLLRSDSRQLEIQLIRDGKDLSVMVHCRAMNVTGVKYQLNNRNFSRLLTPDVGYIYPGTLRTDSIPGLMEKFKDTRGIVIDLRCYPVDDILYVLDKYLMPEPVDFVKFTVGRIVYPGQFTFTPSRKAGKENPDYYKGKIVVIANEETQSHAEFSTMLYRKAPRAIVIGSTTAAADGNVSEIFLPGNMKTLISGIGVYYPDKTGTQRIGIVPDIEVKPTIKGIIEDRDELLEKAVEIIENPHYEISGVNE